MFEASVMELWPKELLDVLEREALREEGRRRDTTENVEPAPRPRWARDPQVLGPNALDRQPNEQSSVTFSSASARTAIS